MACAAPISAVLLSLLVVVMAIQPSTGIPVVPVQLVKDNWCCDDRSVIVYVASSGAFAIGADDIEDHELELRLSEKFRTRAEKVVFVEAAGDLPFGTVASVLARVRVEDVRVALIPPHDKSKGFYCMRLPMPPDRGPIPLSMPRVEHVAPWHGF